MRNEEIQSVVTETKSYYDGPADEIYRRIWGDDVHLGLFEDGVGDLPSAAARTNRVMAEAAGVRPGHRVLDAGCGYGSAARHLARHHDCRVVGTNISQKELDLARSRARAAGLEDRLDFRYGDFHAMDFDDGSFDVVWSQEAFLHAVDKDRVLSECRRVLKDDGVLVFTDILVRKGTPEADRARIYERVRSPDMWDQGDYETALKENGFRLRRTEDWSVHVAPSYAWVHGEVSRHQDELSPLVGRETLEKTLASLSFWIDCAKAGKIGWALFVARKAGPP